MKLVELLARELKAWPDGAEFYCQDYNRNAYPYEVKPERHEYRDVLWGCKGQLSGVSAAVLSDIASDHATAIVTRTDWSAERARIAKPAKKADKDGWIRHRGGKPPVADGVLVDVRNRSGDVCMGRSSCTSVSWHWRHDNHPGDIMAYKLHKPAEQVDDKADLKAAAYDAIQPLQWRDRINEIDATTQALTTERANLVQKLASEGFALIGRINDLLTDAAQKHEDMSDPKNWREGDCFVQTAEDVHGAKKGELWVMSQDDGTTAKAYVRENGDEWYVANSHLKFHSRPSA